MRKLLAMLSLLIAGAALAAPEHLVQGEDLRLRAQPRAKAAVVATLTDGTRVTAVDSLGKWVKVKPLESERAGWIPAEKLSSEAFAAFSKDLQHRMARVEALTGEVFFTGARETGPGKLQVTGAKPWLEQPEEGRQDGLQTLLRVWSELQPSEHASRPVEVVIVDTAGKAHMRVSTDPGPLEQ